MLITYKHPYRRASSVDLSICEAIMFVSCLQRKDTANFANRKQINFF